MTDADNISTAHEINQDRVIKRNVKGKCLSTNQFDYEMNIYISALLPSRTKAFDQFVSGADINPLKKMEKHERS